MARAAGSLALFMIAILCVLSAADRVLGMAQSGQPPVTIGFGASAYRYLARQALAADRIPLARSAAARAIARDPIEQGTVSLLGAAEVAGGEAGAADAAFRVAGRLGWRDPLAQLYWFSRALAVDDYSVAAQRIDALLRTAPLDPRIAAPLRALEESAEGRTALAELLKDDPAWMPSYLDFSGLSPAQASRRTAVVLLALRRGLHRDERLADTLSRTWLWLKDPRRALATWIEIMGRGSLDSAGLWDGDLGSIERTQGMAFRWQSSASSDYETQIATAPTGGHALLVRSDSTAIESVAAQTVVAGPGRYRLDWRTTRADGAGPGDLEIDAACQDGTLLIQSAVASAGDRRWRTFEVPAVACAAVTITIQINPSVNLQGGSSTIYAVALRRLNSSAEISASVMSGR